MTTLRITLACCTLALGATSFASSADTSGTDKPSLEVMQRLDTDHDGQISLTEFYATGPEPLHPRMKQVFESLDKDHTGRLSFADTLKVIATVSGKRPILSPEASGNFTPVKLDVHPVTKRAFVQAKINGVEGTFLLDTGTSDTIVHPDFAKRAGVDFVEICMPITGGNMGKRGDFVSLVSVPDLTIAGTHFRKFHAVLMPPTQPRYEFGKPIDGVLGANVIFAKSVTLDLHQHLLKFEALPADEAEWKFPLRKGEKTATLEADVDGVKIPLMLDSGASIGDTTLINEPYHDALRKLAGDPKARAYTAKTIQVDGRTIVTDAQCRLIPFERSVLGSAFFDRHAITVDIAAGKALIKRNIVAPR